MFFLLDPYSNDTLSELICAGRGHICHSAKTVVGRSIRVSWLVIIMMLAVHVFFLLQ